MDNLVWNPIAIEDGHQARASNGILEIVFSGIVKEGPMRLLAEHALAMGERFGVSTPCAVMIVDLSKLDSFSPEARKVFGTIKPKNRGARHVDVVVVGANIRTKALFALTLTAARLIGDLRFDLAYANTLEEGRALAKSRRDAHVAAGRMRAAPDAKG